MKLEPPLLNLVNRCETICDGECCGIGAYDFSPIQIASYLTMYPRSSEESEVPTLRTQIAAIKASYGASASGGTGATFEDVHLVLTAEQVDAFANELIANLEVALKLVALSDDLRFK